MLGFLKKVRHHGDDLGDIRSHVLGEKFTGYEPAPRPKAQLEPPPFASYQQPPPLPPPMPEPAAPRFGSRYGEPAALSAGFEPAQLGAPEKAGRDYGKDYDVLDRLNLIESQVAAIRSMTETINERIKNIEAKLGARRY